MRPAGGNLCRAYSYIRNIASALRFTMKKVHHLLGIPGGRAYLEAASPYRSHCLECTGNQIGVLRKALQLKRNKVAKHVVDILLIGFTAMLFFPSFRDAFVFGNLPDMN